MITPIAPGAYDVLPVVQDLRLAPKSAVAQSARDLYDAIMAGRCADPLDEIASLCHLVEVLARKVELLEAKLKGSNYAA